MYRIVLAAMSAAVVVFAAGVRAETVAGVHLPDQMRLDGKSLALASCGVRDTLWVDHYVAALYIPDKGRAEPVVRDPKQSKILLVRVVNAEHFPEQLPEQWRKPLQASLSADKFSQVSAVYKKLRKGDTMMFTYSPQGGLTMKVNDQTVVTSGHGVIDAMLRAWQSGEASSETLGSLLQGHGC